METALGRYDDALGHLREMSQLAKRFDIARLIAAARVQLGTLAVMQGRLARQPARAGRSGSLSPPVSGGVAAGAALSFALHAGIAVTDAEASLHAVAVCLAIAPGNVAAVGSD